MISVCLKQKLSSLLEGKIVALTETLVLALLSKKQKKKGAFLTCCYKLFGVVQVVAFTCLFLLAPFET